MSTPTAGPRCPRCRRPLAAWRLQHCVYCGEPFPAELKQGFDAPEALKWIERPALPTDLSKKLELMKVVPIETRRKSRSLVTIIGIVSIPIFGAIFYLLYTMMSRMSTIASLLVLVGGAAFVAYLIWVFARARK